MFCMHALDLGRNDTDKSLISCDGLLFSKVKVNKLTVLGPTIRSPVRLTFTGPTDVNDATFSYVNILSSFICKSILKNDSVCGIQCPDQTPFSTKSISTCSPVKILFILAVTDWATTSPKM